LRVSHALKTNVPMKKANGKNPNAFFQIAAIKEPLVSPKANVDASFIKETIVYDLATQAGKTYVLRAGK